MKTPCCCLSQEQIFKRKRYENLAVSQKGPLARAPEYISRCGHCMSGKFSVSRSAIRSEQSRKR